MNLKLNLLSLIFTVIINYHNMKKLVLFCSIAILVILAKPAAAQTEITFYTTMGNFVTQMYDSMQPITSGNFKTLVAAKFYDGVIFHRVVAGFVIQGGDPTGVGNGGPGYTIPDEFDANAHNVQKALGMANAGPNTGGSQFFINTVNNLNLDANYPVFGIVISNFSVVQAIENVAVNAQDRPLVNVVMDSLRITYNPAGIATEQQNKLELSIGIFPNPASDESVISIYTTKHKTVNVALYNQQGMSIYNQQKQLSNTVNDISLSEMTKGNLAAGVYYIVVTDDKSIRKEKFVVAN